MVLLEAYESENRIDSLSHVLGSGYCYETVSAADWGIIRAMGIPRWISQADQAT
jgi:hypothetical protein